MTTPKRISSSFTLFFFLFVPIFWLVFFGGFMVASFIYANETAFFQTLGYKIGIIILYITGVILFYFTLLQLKRVEIDTDYVYVTNYFKTYRYPFHKDRKSTRLNSSHVAISY